MSDTDDNVIDLDAKRRGRPKKPQSEKEQEHEDLIEAASAWLDENPVREVLKLGCYFIRKENGEWIPIKKDHFVSHWEEWSAKFGKAVTNRLRERGWAFLDATYSFRADIPRDTFNMLDTKSWLVPEEGKYHWLFDVLVQSLGGNKAENMDHLEHVLVYKYLCPSAYTLPCLLIHGEGGVGKNVLVDIVLHGLFGGQTFSGTPKKILGDFNETLKARSVVMVNEAKNDSEVNYDSDLKDTLQSPRITINDKGVSKYQIDNTPLWIISSNQSEGGIWLDRSQADRRYSVLHVKKGQSLPYWIAIHEGDIPLQTKFLDKNDPIFRKWEQWLLNEGGKILNDPTGIARWFGGLCLKHHEKRHPLSLHGEDFMRLMKIQKPVDERICEAVFGDPAFEHIERAVLHKGYVECCKDDGQKRPLKQAKFYERVREWMEHHNMKRSEEGKPELIEAQLRVFQRSLEKEVRPRVWIPADKVQVGGTEQKRHNSTRHLYLADQGYKTIWVGPELGAEG